MNVLRRYAIEWCALGAACVFVTSMFMAGRLYATPPCSDAEGGPCWEAFYEELLADQGTVAALLDLKSRVEKGDSAALFCHPVLHIIGAHAAREYGSLAEAFKYGDPVCRAGYYHGVLEGVFGEEGSGELLSRLDTICADVDGRERYSYEYFSCVHGIGHGLMSYFDHDVFTSLAGCDQMRGAWEQESCYGGVFMQNVLNDTLEDPSEFLRPDEPLYPCTTIGEQYRRACYLMQSSYVLKLTNDFAATFAACDGVEEQHRHTCYESIGRDVSGMASGSIKSVLAFCAFGSKEAEERCVVGAAADFIQSAGVERAYELCRASGKFEQVCTENVAWQEEVL